MQIKIVCTKDEFSAVIRRCTKINEAYNDCASCVLYDFCGEKDGEGDMIENIADFRLTE